MTTYIFAVTGMHCASCGILIDETLEDEVEGVTRSQTSVRKGQTVVTTSQAVSVETMVATIAEVGYQATLEGTS